jgi:isopentenyl diphosphate isomerase/L-lactate dehydrogenase-like FMN-dependent dehydrogenase
VPEGWVNVFDVQREAERKLDPGPLGYFSGGAGDELTVRENVDAWRDWRLRPRQLTGVEEVSTDVATAPARGADADLVGRPVIWGLAAAGAEGAEGALRTLTEELEMALALLGVGRPGDLSHEHLRRALTTRVYSD